jgi:hypothetical protein
MERLLKINPLIYPFTLVTLAYGLGFTVFKNTPAVSSSSLFEAMSSISPLLTHLWGVIALAVVFVGILSMWYHLVKVGRINCFIGFSLWTFAATVYILVGGWLTLFSVAVPSLIFWAWLYFDLEE